MLRYIAALEQLATNDLAVLRGVLLGDQKRLITECWAAIDDDDGTHPERTKQLVVMLAWALRLLDGPEYPSDDPAVATFDSLPRLAEVRAGALDQLGERVAQVFADDEAAVA